MGLIDRAEKRGYEAQNTGSIWKPAFKFRCKICKEIICVNSHDVYPCKCEREYRKQLLNVEQYEWV